MCYTRMITMTTEMIVVISVYVRVCVYVCMCVYHHTKRVPSSNNENMNLSKF